MSWKECVVTVTIALLGLDVWTTRNMVMEIQQQVIGMIEIVRIQQRTMESQTRNIKVLLELSERQQRQIVELRTSKQEAVRKKKEGE